MDKSSKTNKVQTLNEFIKSCITEALLQLLKTEDFNKITISEITGKADVARSSFYRNFKSKEEIIQNYIDSIICIDYYREEGIKSLEELIKAITNIFELILENKEFFIILKKNNLLHLMYDSLQNITPIHINAIRYYQNQFQPPFFAGAAFGVINYWISCEFAQPPEMVAEEFSKIAYSYYKI